MSVDRMVELDPVQDELVDLLVSLAPYQKGEAAAPLLRRIERMAESWVREAEGLPAEHARPVREVL